MIVHSIDVLCACIVPCYESPSKAAVQSSCGVELLQLERMKTSDNQHFISSFARQEGQIGRKRAKGKSIQRERSFLFS
jgi:hypothetical protein